MKILVATTVLPVAPTGGGEVATRAFVDALRRAGHDVEVLGYLRPDHTVPPAGMRAVGRRPIETAAAPVATRAAWATRALLTRRGFSEAKYISRGYRAAVRTAARDADLVVIDHAQMGWLADDVRAPLVHLAHNAEHELYAQMAGRSRRAGAPSDDRAGSPTLDVADPARSTIRAHLAAREAWRLRATEVALARKARAVWTLTEHDARAHAALGATARAFALARRPPTAMPPVRRAGRVALLGMWTWAPNRAGLQWFLSEVLPLLPADLDVVVGGRGADGLDGARARAAGVVPDAGAFLAQAGVVAVPSVAGGGLQIKTLDAIASGAPVVATPLALRGIDHPPTTVQVAGAAPEFAAALARAAVAPSDPAEGRAWASARAERFDSEVAAAALSAAGGRAGRPVPRGAPDPVP